MKLSRNILLLLASISFATSCSNNNSNERDSMEEKASSPTWTANSDSTRSSESAGSSAMNGGEDTLYGKQSSKISETSATGSNSQGGTTIAADSTHNR